MKPITGWILYRKKQNELTSNDHGVQRLLQAAKTKNITLTVYSPNQFELIVTRNDRKSILIDGEPTPLPDFLIPRLSTHTTYFALAVIRQLEKLNVYCCNDSTSIETVNDKLHMHQLLAHNHLPTPKTMLLKFSDGSSINIEMIKKEIGFPLIIKNITGAHGDGIHLCESEAAFEDLVELIYINNNKANIILQEFVSTSYGRDIRVFLVGGKIIGSMQRSSSTGFKANFSRGARVEAIELNPEIERLATETARLARLDIAGIDLLFDKDGYKICEANAAPGFRGLELVVGENIAEQILDYISDKISQHNTSNTNSLILAA